MSINKNNLIVLVLIGVVLGAICSFSPATFIMVIVTVLLCTILWMAGYPYEEKKFLLKLFIWGWGIRVLICLTVYLISAWHGGAGSLFHDDIGWPRTAWLLYQSWLGKFDFAMFQERSLEHQADVNEHYLILLSLLFSVFRYYTPLIAKYANIIFSCITALIIYDLAREIFNQKTAKIAGALTMFTPSVIIWSVVALKETAFIFLVALSMWALVKFIKNKKWHFAALFMLSLFSIYSIRKFFLPVILVTMCLSLLVSWRVNWFKKVALLVAGLVIIRIVLLNYLANYGGEKIIELLATLKEMHMGYVSTGGATVYRLFDDTFYRAENMALLDILKWYIRGVAYLIFAPLPWSMTSRGQLLYMPQMLIWYSLFPFILIGIVCSLRYCARETLPLILLLFLTISLLGLVEGNIGTMVRHRDVLTPFYLIFAAAGIRKTLGYPFLVPEKEQGL